MPEPVTTARCCWCARPLVQVAEVGHAWLCINPDGSCSARQLKFAVCTQPKTKKGPAGPLTYLYVPTPKQTVWHEAVYHRPVTRLMVGGAASPGKSKWLREALYRFAVEVPGFHALLLRKTYKDLEQSHLRFMPFECKSRGGDYLSSDRVAKFFHPGKPDSIIRCGHLEDAGSIENYLSSEYDVIAPDELVTFERDAMLELFSRCRTTNPVMIALRGYPEDDLDGSMVLTASNPGGRGALWVKDFFIDHNPDRGNFPYYRPERWRFFEAKVQDNPYIKQGYQQTLLELPETRRRQLLDGDWNVFDGAFFAEWRPSVRSAETQALVPWHVRDLPIAPGVEWFASMDWGYNAPGVVLFWACLPDGQYHIGYEYKFQGELAEVVARTIKTVCRSLGIRRLRYLVCDPAMKQHTGSGRGETIYETLARYGLPMRAGDNDRRNGWTRVHELFRPASEHAPWLTVSPNCRYLIRTIPAMVQHEKQPDDMDSSTDDHAVDALRYGAMSRPRPTRLHTPQVFPVGTMGWWKKQAAQPAYPVLGSESVRVPMYG